MPIGGMRGAIMFTNHQARQDMILEFENNRDHCPRASANMQCSLTDASDPSDVHYVTYL